MATNLQKKHLTYTIRDFYKDYSKSVKKTKFPKREYRKYRDYLYDVFAECFKKILYDGWHFVMPYSLGEFYIKEIKRLTGKKVYSKSKSIKTGKTSYIFNNHTFRRTYKFVWDRSYSRFDNAKYYKFDIITGKNKLHKKYKVGREAIANFLFSVGKDPKVKIPRPKNRPDKALQEPSYESDR